MPDATCGCPALTTLCRLDELGLVVVGLRLEPDRSVLACGSWRPMTAPRAGADAAGVQEDPGTPSRGSWRTSRWAEPRARLSRRAWALEAIVCQHLSIARVAQGLGVAWNTANDAVLAEGRRC